MKRFFTFLIAVWALLSISQTVKAADVTVYFHGLKLYNYEEKIYTNDDGVMLLNVHTTENDG